MIKVTYHCMNCNKEYSREMFERDNLPKRQQLMGAYMEVANVTPLVDYHICTPEAPLSAIGFAYPIKAEFMKEEEINVD